MVPTRLSCPLFLPGHPAQAPHTLGLLGTQALPSGPPGGLPTLLGCFRPLWRPPCSFWRAGHVSPWAPAWHFL